MKHLKSYNEGILSKAKELINYDKKASQIGKKWVDRVIQDWLKNKDLFRVSIRENSSHTILEYLISNSDIYHADVQIGNRSENDITVKITYIKNILSWSDDKTQARLEVTKYNDYIGEVTIVGRNLSTGELIDDEKGVKDNTYSYVNIPSADAKHLIQSFISIFKSRYPSMVKYYGKKQMLELDSSLKTREIERQNRRFAIKKNERELSEKQANAILSPIIKSLTVTEDDIRDVLIDIEDYRKDINIIHSTDILYNGSLYTNRDQFDKSSIHNYLLRSIWDFNSTYSKNKYGFDINDIKLKEKVPYHKILFQLTSTEDIFEFQDLIKANINRLCKINYLKVVDSKFNMGSSIQDFLDKLAECDILVNNQNTTKKVRAAYVVYLEEDTKEKYKYD